MLTTATFATPLRPRIAPVSPLHGHVCDYRRSKILSANPAPSPTSPARRIDIIAVPMTAGGDVLFPGSSQTLTLPLSDALRASQAPNSEFGYLPVDAWDAPSSVGTVAVVDEFEAHSANDTALVLCSGLERFRVVSLDEGRTMGTVKCFYDNPTEEDRLPAIVQLENKLVRSMTEIVRLSIKISSEGDEKRQKALSKTLKKVEAFCGGRGDTDESKRVLQHSIIELNPHRRREILTFIVMDLLSLSFMARRSLMLETDTGARLEAALQALEPFIRELAAKGAIVSALGRDISGPPHVES